MTISRSESLIKLLIICPIDPAGRKIGGVETAIRTYVKFAPSNFEIEVVGFTTGDQGFRIGVWSETILNGRKIKFLPVIKDSAPNARKFLPLVLRFTAGLARWRHKIDFQDRLLIFHRLEPAYVLKSVPAKKILFLHGNMSTYFNNEYCENKWKKFKKLYFFIEPFFISEMEKIFVVSRSGRDLYQKRYSDFSSRFFFLPTWYDPHIFYRRDEDLRDKIRCRYNISSDTLVFIFIGRLEGQKNPELLIKSFYLISQIYPDSKLLIVGEGSLKEALIRQIEELDFAEKVDFVSFKNQNEIAEIINIANVMLLTSAWEGMPRVVLESLSCGVPVVATDAGETSIVVKDGESGRLISSAEPEDIAEGVRDVITFPLSSGQCQKAVADYSQEKVLSFLYDELRKVRESRTEHL